MAGPVLHRLPNGLSVVAAGQPGAAVAVNVTYRVGSRDESPERTGIAHLFEHLMFEGSAGVAAGEHFACLERYGAWLNGFTMIDRTTYFETVPRGVLPLALWLEADRMRSLGTALNQRSLDTQREVVKNEWRESCNQPYGTAVERLQARLFPSGHAYAHSPIGDMAHLDAMDLAGFRRFLARHYAPDRAVVTVVGAADPEAAVEEVTRCFADIAPSGHEPSAAYRAQLAPLPDPIRETCREPVPMTALYRLWRLPGDGTADCDSAEMALHILAGGPGSRLQARLVRGERSAVGVSGWVHRLAGTSMGLLAVQLPGDGSAAAVEEAVDEEIASLAVTGPDEDEVSRAATALELAALREMSTCDGHADALAQATLQFGEPGRAYRRATAWRAVSGDAVAKIAATWLGPEHCAQLTYLPEEAS
ncbi:M16 family metallopeptidase [Amycolatopsis jejuensis]|uniref:M16 family metallopeptidase n=1 Tax=Amycolatopsis jejuensis TaxID=330084 RepID=UPI00068D7FD8|nr:pitrilysin family protein [Amycolatopsis jejuensis]